MPCNKPLAGVDVGIRQDSGKRLIRILKGYEVNDWQRKQASIIPICCGRCRGCRHEHARQWAVRIMHESQSYQDNCFITLTFDDENLDKKSSLQKNDFQDFLKRFRKTVAPLNYASCWLDPETKRYKMEKKFKPWGIRYFHCGEYGEENSRPHHHAIIFNYDFPNKVVIPGKTKVGSTLYRSPLLERLWPKGYSSIGGVTYASACYVAKYVLKKLNGEMAADHYNGRLSEYTTQSNRPGIACKWYEKYKNTDVFPRDYIVLNGKKGQVVKYYNKRYELTNPTEYADIKAMRIKKAKENINNNSARLKAAEEILIAKDNIYKRTM